MVSPHWPWPHILRQIYATAHLYFPTSILFRFLEVPLFVGIRGIRSKSVLFKRPRVRFRVSGYRQRPNGSTVPKIVQTKIQHLKVFFSYDNFGSSLFPIASPFQMYRRNWKKKFPENCVVEKVSHLRRLLTYRRCRVVVLFCWHLFSSTFYLAHCKLTETEAADKPTRDETLTSVARTA